jgi:two-component system sensor histidine kinase MtrB
MEDALLHNGWLEVASEKNKGTTFRLTLPVKTGYRLTDSPLPMQPTEELA